MITTKHWTYWKYWKYSWLGKETEKNSQKSLIFCQTSLDPLPPMFGLFMNPFFGEWNNLVPRHHFMKIVHQKKKDGFPINISFLQHWEIMCETWLHFCNQWIVACLTFIRLGEEENVENALRYIAQRRRYFSPNFKKVQHDILHQIGRFHPTPRMRYSSCSHWLEGGLIQSNLIFIKLDCLQLLQQ